MKPTKDLYNLLTLIHQHFNKRLFKCELKAVMFTITRRKSIMGCYINQKWVRDNVISDEIQINPTYFHTHPILEIMQTLVHEMVHQWQYNHGGPGRRGYHNKEFATKMMSVGLMPSHTGEVGGNKTGQNMMDYAIEGGKFLIEANKLLAQKTFKSLWYDRESTTLAIGGDGEEAKSKKVKYSCCGFNLWGVPDIHIICGICKNDIEYNI